MGVLILPPPLPPPPVKHDGGPPARRFTIHKQEQIFTIDTRILSFHKRPDALKFAHLIEVHHALTREWRMIDQDQIMYSKKSDTPLEYTHLEDWDPDALKMYCKEHIFGMIEVENVLHDFKLQGNLIRWSDIPHDFQVEYLQRLLGL